MTDEPSNPEESIWGISATPPATPPAEPSPTPPAAPPTTPPPGPAPDLPPPPSGPPPGSPAVAPPPAGPPPSGPPPAAFPPAGFPPAGQPGVPPGPPPGAVPFAVGGAPPPRPPWWKQPWAIIVAILAVLALVGGVVILTGGDDEGSVSTEETEPEETEPEETEPEETDPVTTEASVPDTEAPGTTVPLTLPTTVAPETTTTAAPETTLPPVVASPLGASITLQGSTETIEATVLAIADPAPTYDFSPPEAGMRAVAVQVRVVNTGTVEYLDTANGMLLVDSAGTKYDNSFIPVALSGTFPLTRLLPGDTRVGWVVYEVPTATAVTSFQWNLDGPSAVDPTLWDFAAAAVAPTPTSPPIPAGTPFNAPATLTGGSGQVDVAVVSVTDNAAQVAGEAPLLPGTRLVAFEIALFNSGTAVFTESPDSFLSLVDTNTQWYLTSFLGTTSGPAFPENVALEPGAQLIAYITVEVPVGEQPFKLQAALDNGNAVQMAELAVA